jgi:hypothetical protein
VTLVTIRAGDTPIYRSRLLVQIWIYCGYVYLPYGQADVRIFKSKAIPLQALTGPEGSRTLKLPDFVTIDT